MSSLLNSLGLRTGALCLAFALSGAGLLACDGGDDDDMGDGDTMSETNVGDGDPGDGDPSGDLTYSGDIGPLFTANCSCHSMGGSAEFLILNHANIVDKASGQASGLSLVATGDSANSYLVNKLRGTQASVMGSGNAMPPTAALAEADIAMVEEWIDAGAMP